jgi:DNA polymerase-3 subunit epsilon
MDKELIKNLENTGKFKVIRKYEKPDFYYPDDGSIKSRGLFIDTETSGLNHQLDKIVELAIIPFEFGQDGRIFKLHDGYCGLEDPQISLPQKIISLTGLTNEMLKGKTFNDKEIEKLVASSDLVVAHHAAFDRPFLEKRFPIIFRQKTWCCSLRQIPWAEEGFASQTLEYLAYRFKFFFDNHRAETDALAGLHILAQHLPSGNLVLDCLLKNARRKLYRIWALGSPFGKKDILKGRGYQWFPKQEGRNHSWYIEIDEESLQSELDFLREEIFKKEINLPIDIVKPEDRFSERI